MRKITNTHGLSFGRSSGFNVFSTVPQIVYKKGSLPTLYKITLARVRKDNYEVIDWYIFTRGSGVYGLLHVLKQPLSLDYCTHAPIKMCRWKILAKLPALLQISVALSYKSRSIWQQHVLTNGRHLETFLLV